VELSDEILVRKTLEGDDSAFSKLINRHSGVVHGLCYHLSHNFTDAEDLAQEAFIRAYFKLPSLSNPSKFLSWLRQITVNVYRDWLRRQKNDTVSLEEIHGRQPATSPSPAEICEAKELQEKVAEAIASLSEKNRQAVTLYYLDGCSCNEVAGFLDVSISVVQSRLYEARKKLKKGLMAMVKEDLGSRRLAQEFEQKVRKAIDKAKKAQEKRDYHEVIIRCDEALDTLTKLDDSVEHKGMKKEVLLLKGDAVFHESKEKAIKYYEDVLELEKEIGDKFSQARATRQVAWQYECANNREKALEYYNQSLSMFTELEHKKWQAMVYYDLGDCLPEGNVEERREKVSHYQRAFELFAEAGVKHWLALSHAAINFQKHLIEEQIVGLGAVFYGYVCEKFEKSSDAVFYIGSAGTQMGGTRSGSYSDEYGRKYVWTNVDEVKDTFNASPFRFLPEKTKILDFSLSVGDSWSMNVPSGGLDSMKVTVTIESDSETVSVPADEFENCLKTKIVTSEEPKDCEGNRCGEREFIYAPGVGLVKSTFVRRNGTVGIAQLKEYTLSDDNSKDYFPLAIGNKWFYEWADKDGFFPTTDVYEVVEMDNSRYYLSHYYYALKYGNAELVAD